MIDNALLVVASGDKSSDLRYLCGFNPPDDIIFCEFSGRRIIVVSKLEFSRAESQAHSGVEVWLDTELCGCAAGISRQVAALAGKLGTDCFSVPADFPLGLADELRSAGMKIIPSTHICPGREFKRNDELNMITASQRAGEAGCRRAVEVLRGSEADSSGVLRWRGEILTSEILRGEIDGVMLRYGMIPCGTICAGGAQSAQPHNQGSGPLYAGTPVVMDIFPRSGITGYWGDLTRTVVRGTAPDVVRRAWNAVKLARDESKKLIRAGAVPADIHNCAAGVLDDCGFHTGADTRRGNYGFIHSLGHGVGLDIHEAPRLSPRGKIPLRGGEVVTVEPGVYYPEWGGVRIEDLVYVPEDGSPCRTVTSIEDFFEI